MVINLLAYLFGQLFRDMFARGLETAADVVDPVRCSYLLQINSIAELVKRQALFLEQLVHQMFLAAEQTIRDRFLQLPYGAQPLLECFGIPELGDLLKLVDADDDIITFFLRYLFGKLQDFVNVAALGIQFERYGEIRHRIRPHRNFGADTGKKQFDMLQPFVHFRGGLFENGGHKGIVKIPVAAA